MGECEPVDFPMRPKPFDALGRYFAEAFVIILPHCGNVCLVSGVPAKDVTRPRVVLDRVAAPQVSRLEPPQQTLILSTLDEGVTIHSLKGRAAKRLRAVKEVLV